MQLLYIFFDIQTVLFVVPEDFVLRVVLVALWWVGLCGGDVGEKVCGTLCVCVKGVSTPLKKKLKFITKFR